MTALRSLSHRQSAITRQYIEGATAPRLGEIRHVLVTRHCESAMANLTDVDVIANSQIPSGRSDSLEGGED